MSIQITINTDQLTDLDKNILAAISAVTGGTVASTEAAQLAERVAAAPKATPAPAKKAAAAKPAPKAEEPEAEEVVEAEVVEDGDGPTLEEAIALATEVVSGGNSAKVKAALATVGAAKVSALEGEQIAQWIAEVQKLVEG